MFVNQTILDAYLQYLVDWDVLDEDAALDVLEQQKKETPPIGRLAMLSKVMTMKQVVKVLDAQVDSDLRFGEVALELGFMTDQQLLDLLESQNKCRPGVNKIIVDLGFADQATVETRCEDFLNHIGELVT